MHYCREEQIVVPWPWPASTWQKAEQRCHCKVWHQEQHRKWWMAPVFGQWAPCLGLGHWPWVEHLSDEMMLPVVTDKVVKKDTSDLCFQYKCISLVMTSKQRHWAAPSALDTFSSWCDFSAGQILSPAPGSINLREGRERDCWTILLLRYNSCQGNVSTPYIRKVQIRLRTTCGLGRNVISHRLAEH